MGTEDNQRLLKNQRILLLDNYDSFTYNILHYVEELDNIECTVIRNDDFDLKQINHFDSIILSPGPGLPEEAGILIPLIKAALPTKKILGICLGHQALAVALGGRLKQLNKVMHGLQRNCIMKDTGDPLFFQLPGTFTTGRYHSWVVDELQLPDQLIVSAIDDDNQIMAIHHKALPVYGVQFHPESIMTPFGKKIIQNWIALPF